MRQRKRKLIVKTFLDTNVDKRRREETETIFFMDRLLAYRVAVFLAHEINKIKTCLLISFHCCEGEGCKGKN